MEELLKACHKFIAQISPSGDERYYDIDPQDLKEFCEAVEAAQPLRAGGQLPLCPECGETLLEDDRRWECVNEKCGNCR